MADVEDAPPPPPTLESMFIAFSKSGAENNADGLSILLSQSDAWMHQAKIFSKNLTLTDTGVLYNTFKKLRLNFEEYKQFLQMICEEKRLNFDEVSLKMINCGMPGSQGGKNK